MNLTWSRTHDLPRDRQLKKPIHHDELAMQTLGFLVGLDFLLYDLILADYYYFDSLCTGSPHFMRFHLARSSYYTRFMFLHYTFSSLYTDKNILS